MVTRNSIDLTRISEPCYATAGDRHSGGCKVLIRPHEGCGSYKCPFYKPKGCRSWIRLKDRTGINLIPPEELQIGGKK